MTFVLRTAWFCLRVVVAGNSTLRAVRFSTRTRLGVGVVMIPLVTLASCIKSATRFPIRIDWPAAPRLSWQAQR
jgi:hypothetical protein